MITTGGVYGSADCKWIKAGPGAVLQKPLGVSVRTKNGFHLSRGTETKQQYFHNFHIDHC